MRRLITFILGVAGIATVGCSTHDASQIPLQPTDSVVTGAFSLTLANGNPLPLEAFQTNTDLWAIAGEKIVLSQDLSWTDTTSYQVFSLATNAERDTISTAGGTYSVANGQINFSTTANGTLAFTGSVTGNILVVLLQGSRFVYTKQ